MGRHIVRRAARKFSLQFRQLRKQESQHRKQHSSHGFKSNFIAQKHPGQKDGEDRDKVREDIRANRTNIADYACIEQKGGHRGKKRHRYHRQHAFPAMLTTTEMLQIEYQKYRQHIDHAKEILPGYDGEGAVFQRNSPHCDGIEHAGKHCHQQQHYAFEGARELRFGEADEGNTAKGNEQAIK